MADGVWEDGIATYMLALRILGDMTPEKKQAFRAAVESIVQWYDAELLPEHGRP